MTNHISASNFKTRDVTSESPLSTHPEAVVSVRDKGCFVILDVVQY